MPKRQAVYDEVSGLYLLPLTKGQHTILDQESIEWVCQWNWSADYCDPSYYAKRRQYLGGGRAAPRNVTVYLHRALAERWGWHLEGMKVDHISRDTLDNRAENLRVTTSAQNSHNSVQHTDNQSGYKGVSPYRDRYRAEIMINGEKLTLGYFDTPEEGAAAYEAASLRHHGAHGRTESGSNLLKE